MATTSEPLRINSFVTIRSNAFLSTKITGDLNAPNLTSFGTGGQCFYHCNLLNVLNLGTIKSYQVILLQIIKI